MDPIVIQLNNDYNAFNRYLTPIGNPVGLPAVPAPVQPSMICNVQSPNAILLPAPDERPFPATLFVEKELMLMRMQGFAGAIMLLFLIILKGWAKLVLVVGIAAWVVYVYMTWQADVARAKMEEKGWLDKFIPNPPPQHYVVHQIPA